MVTDGGVCHRNKKISPPLGGLIMSARIRLLYAGGSARGYRRYLSSPSLSESLPLNFSVFEINHQNSSRNYQLKTSQIVADKINNISKNLPRLFINKYFYDYNS
jgi:hypothetical protein